MASSRSGLKISSKLASDLQRVDAQVASKRQAQMLQYVTSTLTAEPALVESVHNLMMAEVFENRVEGTDPQRFHRSAVRWTDLSVKTWLDCSRPWTLKWMPSD